MLSNSKLLLSATKFRRLFFYTCVSVHRGGLPQCMLGYPPGADTPTLQQMATAVDSMHPTGMHSCTK